VQDALEAVGGMTDQADVEQVNLAGILRDGDQVHVPLKGQEAVLATPSGGEVVRINTATAEELDTLPGVGPSLAQRIIEYRDANGAFQNLDELDAVEGIGPSLLDEIRELVVFD
jgi:competence protein ComEA